MTLSDYQRVCSLLRREREHALASLAEEGERKLACREALENAREAREIVQAAALATQRAVHDGVAGVATKCLRSVFGQDYQFEILFHRKRGRTEAQMVLSRGGNQVDPLDASGGGIVDVISLSLRLACIMLAKPAVRKLLVLDEPLRFLSKEYRPAAALLLEKLAEETGVQIVLCTHAPEFEVGTVVRIGERE